MDRFSLYYGLLALKQLQMRSARKSRGMNELDRSVHRLNSTARALQKEDRKARIFARWEKAAQTH